MNNILDLVSEVIAVGATIRAEGAELVIRPAVRVPLHLKERLRANKTELLSLLQAESGFVESINRPEAAQVSVAIWPDGRIRIVSGNSIRRAWEDGGTVWITQEMNDYLRLNPADRKLMRELKGLKR